MFSKSQNSIPRALGMIGIFCFGAYSQPVSQTVPQTINIGVINSLTGRFDSFGKPVQRGLEMAVEEINQKGGIKGRKIKLLIEDDASSSDRAVKAFEKLATESKVGVIIGPLSSGASVATMPLANKYKVVQIPPIAGHSDLTRDNDFTFRVYTNDEITARDIAKFAAQKFKAKRVAVLAEDTEFGKLQSSLLNGSLKKAQIQMVAEERVKPDSKEFQPQLTRINQAKPDLMVYPSLFLEGSVELLKQMKAIVQAPRIPTIVVGTACLLTLDTVSDPPPDIFFLNETFGKQQRDNPVMQNFITSYQQHFNATATPYSAAAHATVYVVKSAIEKGGLMGAQIKSALQNVQVNTAFGKVQFDSKGGNLGAGYSLYQLKNKELVLAR